jgi:hypothetical protein
MGFTFYTVCFLLWVLISETLADYRIFRGIPKDDEGPEKGGINTKTVEGPVA